MAPPRLYPLPSEQLVDLLAQSRREGLSFEDAWQRAIRPGKATVMTNTKNPPVACVRWPTDSSDRIAWIGAIHELKDQYRRLYQRRPATRRERAVCVLVNVLLEAGDRQVAARGIQRRPAVRSAA